MTKILYLGLENKPYKVYETAHVENFRVVYQYENDNGKKVMLRTLKNSIAYHPAHDFKEYPNNVLPVLQANKLFSIDILSKGYSEHDFELVEVN
jgi:hypothetical protein